MRVRASVGVRIGKNKKKIRRVLSNENSPAVGDTQGACAR